MNKSASIIYLLLLPIIWVAPLFGTGLLPWFDLDQMTILSGVKTLLHKDIPLALIIILFVMVMPMAKAIATCLHAFGFKFPNPKTLYIMARLSLLDIFLIAITIVAVKGIGIGRIEIFWGFWFFAGYVALGYGLAIKKIIP